MTAEERNAQWPLVEALPGAAERMMEFLQKGPAPHRVMIYGNVHKNFHAINDWLQENVGPCMIKRLPPENRPYGEGPRADYEWTDGNWIGSSWPTVTPEGRVYLFTNENDAFAFKMRWA